MNMSKTEMIAALSNAFSGHPAALEARRRRLQRMTAAALRREMLLRGLAEYDEPEDDEDCGSDYTVPAGMFALPPGPLYAE